jgi:hypothetical protein
MTLEKIIKNVGMLAAAASIAIGSIYSLGCGDDTPVSACCKAFPCSGSQVCENIDSSLRTDSTPCLQYVQDNVIHYRECCECKDPPAPTTNTGDTCHGREC